MLLVDYLLGLVTAEAKGSVECNQKGSDFWNGDLSPYIYKPFRLPYSIELLLFFENCAEFTPPSHTLWRPFVVRWAWILSFFESNYFNGPGIRRSAWFSLRLPYSSERFVSYRESCWVHSSVTILVCTSGPTICFPLSMNPIVSRVSTIFPPFEVRLVHRRNHLRI